MRRIVVIEHHEQADTNTGLRHLSGRGFDIVNYRPDLGEALPEIDEHVAGVIIGGGPQMASDLDRFAYLRDEMAFADKAMTRRVPLLGICLGAQLIARHLGASVSYHPDGHVALGYYPLSVTEAGKDFFPDGMMTLAGNAQGFECPRDATLLAAGRPFPNQAFQYEGTTMAMQFHPEVTAKILDQWKVDLGGNASKPGAGSLEELDAGFASHNETLAGWYRAFLDRFFDRDLHLVS